MTSPAPSLATSSKKNDHVDIVEDLPLGTFTPSPNNQITELLHVSQVNTFTRMTYLQEKECRQKAMFPYSYYTTCLFSTELQTNWFP